MAIPVDFDDPLLLTIEPTSLPENWRAPEGLAYTQALGDAWIKRKASVLLAVPSRVVPAERNYLLNPEHPDVKQARIGEHQLFHYDPRLLKR